MCQHTCAFGLGHELSNFPHTIHCKVTVISRGAKPDNNEVGRRLDLGHQWDLMGFLVVIVLVDA